MIPDRFDSEVIAAVHQANEARRMDVCHSDKSNFGLGFVLGENLGKDSEAGSGQPYGLDEITACVVVHSICARIASDISNTEHALPSRMTKIAAKGVGSPLFHPGVKVGNRPLTFDICVHPRCVWMPLLSFRTTSRQALPLLPATSVPTFSSHSEPGSA
ncbi:hypothetical protein SDC9_190168 [bioreactor metagenome]|uniref:Uncharacterized protein n=1 Tax=bioreactor metagenome TaxID=1076179 RepID=A0A645HU80_9ZZZZ